MAFSFFDLPGEIRRQIYCQLLVNQANGETPTGKICQGKGPQQTVEPAILRVCKQMHDETASILYGQNEFCIYVDFYRFKQFLHLIGQDNAALIRKIWLCSFGRHPDLHTVLTETIDLSRGPLQALKKVTIGHSPHLPPYDRTERRPLTQSDLLEVCNAITRRSNLMVMVVDGDALYVHPENELKMQTTIRFAVLGEDEHQTKDLVVEFAAMVAKMKPED